MTENIDPAAAQALIAGAALAELAAQRCVYPDLFLHEVAPRLHIDKNGHVREPDTGDSVAEIVRQVKADYVRRAKPGTFFHP
jgi:hypothetical protein